MPHSRHQFGLRALFAAITLVALVLAVFRYWIDGTDFFGLLVLDSLAAGTIAIAIGLTVCALEVAITWRSGK